MFETLQERLSGIFDKLTGRGSLSESDVDQAMREVRRALIEADVALEVVKSFVEQVRAKAVGQDVVKSVTPGQMVVKIVHDALVETLGGDEGGINLKATPPVPLLMVGLQGSGKTTTTAKIAKRIVEHDRKRVLMASLDTRRPAAQEQLEILGIQIGVDSLPIIKGEDALAIARRAVSEARRGGYDVLLLDTAGRLHIDQELMAEVEAVRDIANPKETLLVADALTGQDAVRLARSFDEQIGISGIVLTRIDGDGRGGAALSMRAVTGKPIKLLGTGERLEALEEFRPSRIAGRILGMGDVVSLVEKAAQSIDQEKAKKIALRMKKGTFDLDDLAEQLQQMRKLGGMSGVLGLLPGVGKMKKHLEGMDLDNLLLKRQLAIISSMTTFERRNPKVMNAARKRRVARGSGTKVEEINRLLKMHLQMSDMMKKVGRNPGLFGKLFGQGPAMPDETELRKIQEGLAKLDPSALPAELKEMMKGFGEGGLPEAPDFTQGTKGLPGVASGLPGLGGGLPGLGGKPGLKGLGGAPFRGFPGPGMKKK
jgi:signal recognition particle subunit SRP54